LRNRSKWEAKIARVGVCNPRCFARDDWIWKFEYLKYNLYIIHSIHTIIWFWEALIVNHAIRSNHVTSVASYLHERSIEKLFQSQLLILLLLFGAPRAEIKGVGRPKTSCQPAQPQSALLPMNSEYQSSPRDISGRESGRPPRMNPNDVAIVCSTVGKTKMLSIKCSTSVSQATNNTIRSKWTVLWYNKCE